MTLGACPSCASGLRPIVVEGVAVAHCGECSGTWLPGHRLDVVLDALVPDASWLDDLLTRVHGAQVSRRRCPCCDGVMETLLWPDTEVSVDRCPSGCGAWVDAGELDRIASHRIDVVAQKPASELLKAILHEVEQVAEGREPPAMAVSEIADLLRLLGRRVFVRVPGVAVGANAGSQHG